MSTSCRPARSARARRGPRWCFSVSSGSSRSTCTGRARQLEQPRDRRPRLLRAAMREQRRRANRATVTAPPRPQIARSASAVERARPAGFGEPHERLEVALRTGKTRARVAEHRCAGLRAAPPTAISAPRRAARSRTTPPLPTASRPTSNCGLTIARQSNRRRRACEHRRQHLLQRDERDVDHDQAGSVRERVAPAASGRCIARAR